MAKEMSKIVATRNMTMKFPSLLMLPFLLRLLPLSEACSAIPPSASCVFTFYTLHADADRDDASCDAFSTATATYHQPSWTPVAMFYNVCQESYYSHYPSRRQRMKLKQQPTPVAWTCKNLKSAPTTPTKTTTFPTVPPTFLLRMYT